MAFTRFATSEPWDPASGERLNKLGDELQEQINVLQGSPNFTGEPTIKGKEIALKSSTVGYKALPNTTK